MKRALIVSRNLIGDALNAGIAIREWFRLHREEYDEVDLLTQQDHVTRLYSGLEVNWTRINTDQSVVPDYTDGKEYDKVYILGAGKAGEYCDGKKVSIVEGFCHQLEIEPPVVPIVDGPMGKFKAWKPYYDPTKTLAERYTQYVVHDTLDLGKIEKDLILFSPFSASCSSRKGEAPNKMLYPSFWVTILEYLRTLGPIRMLGAPYDEPDKSWQLSEEEIMTGVPLDWLAAVMQKAKLVITIDNGMGHLAASQDAKHILFYPMCLGLHFILPWGANNTVPIQVEPTSIQLPLLMASIKRSVKHLGIN